MTDTPDWNQDSIDERVRALAAEHYHRPEGSVPRDTMWAAIAPAWQAERVAAAAPRRGFGTARWRWSAVLAAGLIIGIVLDRGVESYLGASRVVVTRQRTAGVTVVAPAQQAPVAANRSTESTSVEHSAAPRSPRAERQLAARAPERREVPPGSGVAPAGRAPLGASARTLYQAAAVQTLAQAEALLTSYRRGDDMVGGRDQEAMLQAARWARDVLSSTRLLLDSPASRDPQLRALLSDLELVLAQIVQLSGAPLQAGERELIERAMRDRDLLPRLRSAVPAGTTTS
jgi:hypothetical protein